MAEILGSLSSFFSDVYNLRCLLFSVQAASFLFKVSLLFFFTKRIFSVENPPIAWRYFFVVISCSALEDISWMLSLARYTFAPQMDYRPVILIIRLIWSTNILMYQSFALFIESFTRRPGKISYHQMVSCCISAVLFFYPLWLAVTQYQNTAYRPTFEFDFYNAESIYALLILMPFTLLYAWRKIQKNQIPKILKKQLESLQLFIISHVLINIFQTFPIQRHGISSPITIFAAMCSNAFLSIALYYCLKKIVRLRFLNMHHHVHSTHSFNFTNDFKNILESLGSATSVSEVTLLTQRFFAQAFQIPMSNVSLHIRTSEPYFQAEHPRLSLEQSNTTVEQFLTAQNNTDTSVDIHTYMQNNKILIYDEVEYDDFYETAQTRATILAFLRETQADIFLPVYEQNAVIGYIMVERNARGSKLYNDIERDEMIVFASFLSKIINLLQNRNLSELLKQRKDIIEELYQKHQEINQYKESIRSFLHNNQRRIGIIFYKNGKFVPANHEARELIELDPNQHEGHPLVKALRQTAKQTLAYKANQTQLSRTATGKRLVIMGIPHADHNDVILAIHYPDVYDTIKSQIDAIHDPSDWDYLLYLETTKSGKLINQLIPGNSELFLNFKIELLKLALGKKALLLDLPEDDLLPLVELLHHISLRESLYILELNAQVSQAATAIKLFGINPIYGTSADTPILEKLNKKGTLLIKGIHLLDVPSQDNLAQLIRYGFYTIFKSDKRVQSDVRVICSTNQDLSTLVQEGRFSRSLFNELRKETLTMPALLTLSDEEMNALVDGFTDQAMSSHEFKNLVELSDRERGYIAAQRPISLNELKTRVQQLLINKSKKVGVYQEAQFDSGYSVTDPKLIEAARLGKYALKDPKMLQTLWNKFKNQNQIALFLGVNRSSVHRRCREYNIE